jgi:hypothetical protein
LLAGEIASGQAAVLTVLDGSIAVVSQTEMSRVA